MIIIIMFRGILATGKFLMSQIRKNPFEVLGLSKSADDEEIKRTYLKLAKQYHPDVNPNYS
jgi:curved DNA-binding protein CbpA